ncbi:MAG: hypothetical protein PHC46_01105 [Clostridia bacterium]|nr:hypothetical protein [Clostridia bacterium]
MGKIKKDIIKKCDVCGQIVLVDQYGSGDCEHCGWDQTGSDLEKKYKVGYTNLVPLSKAKQLYKEGKPFLPNFEEFINNLIFYGEMQFDYLGKKYIVIRYTDYLEIEFYEDSLSSEIYKFKSYDEFRTKANIDGKLLKDIWHDVENADFLD